MTRSTEEALRLMKHAAELRDALGLLVRYGDRITGGKSYSSQAFAVALRRSRLLLRRVDGRTLQTAPRPKRWDQLELQAIDG